MSGGSCPRGFYGRETWEPFSLTFIANAWVRALLTQPYPASTRTEPGAPRKGHWLGRQQEPHPSPQGLLQVIPLLAFLPIGLPHSRPFHPSGMCLEPPFSSPAPPPVRGVDTRNPGSNMAELNDPTDHHTHTHPHTHTHIHTHAPKQL